MGVSYVYVKDRFVPVSQAAVSIAERGFRYGDGVFETLRIHDSAPYQWELHLNRLTRGLYYVRIDFDTAILEPLVHTLITRNQLHNGLLRLSISRGEGGRGYLPKPGAPPTLVMETFPLPAPPKAEVSLWHSSHHPVNYEGHKTSQGLIPTLARLEAQENQCFEALLSREDGTVMEASGANLFWLKDEVLYTPAFDTGVLQGTIREAVLRLSPWPVEEGRYGLRDLRDADGVVLTNVGWLVLPVSRLEPQGYHWQSQALADRLRCLIDTDMSTYATRSYA